MKKLLLVGLLAITGTAAQASQTPQQKRPKINLDPIFTTAEVMTSFGPMYAASGLVNITGKSFAPRLFTDIGVLRATGRLGFGLALYLGGRIIKTQLKQQWENSR